MEKIYGVEIPEGIEISGYEDLFKWRKPEKDPAKYLDIPLDRLREFKGHPFRVVDNNNEKPTL